MKTETRNILTYAVAALLTGVGVHLAQEFRFYNIAVNDLFLYDWADMAAVLAETGGLAALAASFLTQFMNIPFVGTVIVTGLYIFSAWLLGKILFKLNGRVVSYGLAFLPTVFLFLCMENDYYRFQGHAAFMMVVAALYAYVSIPEGKAMLRYAAGAVFVPLLYHLAGSVSLVFAVSAFLWEIARNGVKGIYALAYPVELLLTAFIYVKLSLAAGWEYALTPFMYYDWPSTYFFPIYAWVSLTALIILSWLISFRKNASGRDAYRAAAAFIASICIAGYFYDVVHSRSYYRLIQEQHWAMKGDWDRIIETADRRQPDYLISYLNLALANKGQLVERLGHYNPQPVSTVMYPTPNLKTGLTLQSTVYMSWNYHSAARQAAFDANMVTSGMRNPHQLKVLVLTNLALGAPDVAEKYIGILEKTLFYRGWAKDMRGRMAVLPAPVLPMTDGYVRHNGLKGDMLNLLEADPSNRILSQFYESYLLLETLEERR